MINRYLGLATLGGILLAGAASAASFPITELGNCRDQQECHLFCEVPTNKAACWSYQTYGTGTVLAETDTVADDSDAVATPTPLAIFPIAELGNCTDIKSCKAYCDVPTHFAACQQVAQKHSLTRAATSGQQTALLAHAKDELGCTSLQQCRAFCAQVANSEQCQAVAEKYGPAKYRIARQALLEKARTTLGCATAEECRIVCANQENAAQCRLFTKEHIPASFQRKIDALKAERTNKTPPLPCRTLEECRTYCSDPAHVAVCAASPVSERLKQAVESNQQPACATAEECEKQCQTNPDTCPQYKASADYKNLQRQRELRLKEADTPNTANKSDLERYRRSLIQKDASPTSLPAATATPAN